MDPMMFALINGNKTRARSTMERELADAAAERGLSAAPKAGKRGLLKTLGF